MLATLTGLDHLVVACATSMPRRGMGGAGLQALAARAAQRAYRQRQLYDDVRGGLPRTAGSGDAHAAHNQALRDFLAVREGLDRAAFTTTDAAAGADARCARRASMLLASRFQPPRATARWWRDRARASVSSVGLSRHVSVASESLPASTTRATRCGCPRCCRTPMARDASGAAWLRPMTPMAPQGHWRRPRSAAVCALTAPSAWSDRNRSCGGDRLRAARRHRRRCAVRRRCAAAGRRRRHGHRDIHAAPRPASPPASPSIFAPA